MGSEIAWFSPTTLEGAAGAGYHGILEHSWCSSRRQAPCRLASAVLGFPYVGKMSAESSSAVINLCIA